MRIRMYRGVSACRIYLKKGKESRISFLFLEVFPYFLFYIFIHSNKHCYFFPVFILNSTFTVNFLGQNLNPCFIRIVRNIFVVKPYAKTFARHKLFAFVMQGFVIIDIEIINVSSSTDSLVNPDFLFGCRIYFRLEAL